jgi:hypothetical protein
VESIRKIIIESNASPADTAALMFGTALSVASRFELPIGAAFKDLYDAAITAVVSRYTEPLVYKILTETGPVKMDEATAQKIAKNIAQGMLWDPATRSYLTLWLISRVDLATAKIRQEPLGLHFDLVQTVGKLCGFGIENLKHYSLITEKTINETEVEKLGRKAENSERFVETHLIVDAVLVPWCASNVDVNCPG